jgi:hypothetical protein
MALRRSLDTVWLLEGGHHALCTDSAALARTRDRFLQLHLMIDVVVIKPSQSKRGFLLVWRHPVQHPVHDQQDAWQSNRQVTCPAALTAVQLSKSATYCNCYALNDSL